MLYGTVTVALAWLLFASVVLVPLGQSAFLWWPAACLAALVAMLQAVAWHPVPLPYLRTLLVIALLPLTILLGALSQLAGWSNGVVCALYLAIIAMSGLIALRGLTLARSGLQTEKAWLPERRQTANHTLRTFSTPLQAQVWLEWKRNGLMLPLFALWENLFFAALFLLVAREHDLWMPFGLGNIEVRSGTMVFLIIVPLEFLMALAIGCSPRKSDTLRPDMSLQPFLATRPLTNVQIVISKLLSTAISALVSAGIQALFLIAWLFLPARQDNQTGNILTLILPHLPAAWPLYLIAGFILFTVTLWLCGVGNLWSELYGRSWITNGFGVAFGGTMGGIVLIGVLWAPSHLPQIISLVRWLPTLGLILLGLKLALVAWTFTRLYRYRQATPSQLASVAGIWLTVAVSLFFLLWWRIPAGLVTAQNLAISIALLLPIARLSLAPLALYANRHR